MTKIDDWKEEDNGTEAILFAIIFTAIATAVITFGILKLHARVKSQTEAEGKSRESTWPDLLCEDDNHSNSDEQEIKI